MRIKTFQGRTLEEVLPQIREQLGPNAVVVGQRQKVQGGVAGFFGTKVIEVTAADSMPSDDELVDLEDQMMGHGGGDAHAGNDASDGGEAGLADKFRAAMAMGRRGGLDVTDEWDPSQDAELAQEYGRVLEHAAAAGFSELDVPSAQATVSLATTPIDAATTEPIGLDAMAQARALADRAHHNVRAATERVESAGAYAPPRAMPQAAPPAITTFSATVQQDSVESFEPQAIPHASAAAATVEHALRTDLAMPRSTDEQLATAIGAAIDAIDLTEIAALRSAVDATRRASDDDETREHARTVIADLDERIDPIVATMLERGVDRDVVDHVLDAAIRHRLPFGGLDQDVTDVVRSVMEELLPVHSGFPTLDRAHCAAFVGPANAGRTTTIAKLASRYSSTGMRVGIVTIVDVDPGVPVMADPTLAKLNADVRYATGPSQALDAMSAFGEHDLVLVDTPGDTYTDPHVFALVQSCLLAIGVDDVHVVVPLTTSGREARSIVDAFRPAGANRLIVTRVDESRHIGELLNFGFRLGLPMTFVSEGRRVPEDIRAASAREIADRILAGSDTHRDMTKD